ncbi:carboxypeptidase-like regulatory domain-containing protein [Winogradskyella sp. PE311]|uniref:carboxypeptidase-like regulatory domain-containing protein n=1 Tax=Winogradskyella sp. PE311 TaxID=3366943 RepID=UPI0039804B84
MLKYRALILMLFFCAFTSAQSQLELLCRVIDKESKIAVSYATIQIVNTTKGTIANIDGDFRIPLKFWKENGKILISSIGFETKLVDLKNLNSKGINVLEITPKAEELSQVVIKASKKSSTSNLSAYTIVKNAIQRIPQNYPSSKFSKIAYYRDYQIVNNTYYNLNEAIIESFDAGFQTDVIMDKFNQNALYSYRENNEFPRDSILQIPYDGKLKFINNTDMSSQGGNELGILNIHNPIRNFEQLSFSFVYVFKKKFLDNHELTNIKKVYLNDEVLYEINFKAKQSLTKTSHKASGKIYIAKSDYAIHKLTYSVYELKVPDPLFEVSIEYKKKNDFMFLNYITFNNQFIVNNAYKFDVTNVDYNRKEQAFFIAFNNEIDTTTLDRKDFKFRFNKKKMMVKSLELADSVTVKVNMADWSLPDVDEETDMSQFTYKIKNINDISNRKLYDSPKVRGFQYREFFVQEVFENKERPQNVMFINKFQPLSKAELNDLDLAKSYWLNTPLKSKRN